MIRTLFNRLRSDQDGIAIVEFALISPVFFMLLLGTLDMGYQAYMRNLMTGVLEDAARQSSVGGVSSTDIDTFIKNRIKILMPAGKRSSTDALKIEKKAFHNFSNVGQPEKITSDTAPLGSFNNGDCYEDANANNSYDATGGSDGVGGADDIVFYKVTVKYPRMFPVATMFGWGPDMEVSVNSIIRNQPFNQQTTPIIRCTNA